MFKETAQERLDRVEEERRDRARRAAEIAFWQREAKKGRFTPEYSDHEGSREYYKRLTEE